MAVALGQHGSFLCFVFSVGPDLTLSLLRALPLSFIRQAYNTNGTIVEDAELGSIIQMQGDQRKNIVEALTQWNICAKDLVKVHGF